VADLHFEEVTKVFPDGTLAVDRVSLSVDDGQVLVLVGPSGCGKTTLLRMAAGLEELTEGVIRIGDRIVNDVSSKERDIAMVFQNYALYPHMTVEHNMGFGLKLRHVPRSRIRELVGSAAQRLSLSDQLAKKPRQLSGGQRQRVAMGRAIVREPKAFLLDEPLSNLDAKLRTQMRTEIARIQRELGVTTVYVTHDQTEAMTLGDVVAVMRNGVVQQVASPDDVYSNPENLFVAGFIGSPAMNLVSGTLQVDGAGLAVEIGSTRFALPRELLARRPRLSEYAGRCVAVGIRPEHIDDATLVPTPDATRCLDVEVELRERMGAETYVYFSLDAPPVAADELLELAADNDASTATDLVERAQRGRAQVVARLNPASRAREGESLRLVVNTDQLHFFDLDTGTRIDG
jgi:multiple sugar transport system ATP-binding protein